MADRQVVKEFLGAIIKAIGKKKGKSVARKFLNSPGMKKLAKQSSELSNDIRKDLKSKAKEGDKDSKDLLNFLDKLEY
tara:strand:- start:310 stop:543 length:234 start_codon:yes stop_codon:yes gene_type:complete